MDGFVAQNTDKSKYKILKYTLLRNFYLHDAILPFSSQTH